MHASSCLIVSSSSGSCVSVSTEACVTSSIISPSCAGLEFVKVLGSGHGGDLIFLPAAVALEFGLLGDRPTVVGHAADHESVGSGALGSQAQRRRGAGIIRHRPWKGRGSRAKGSARVIRACSSRLRGLGRAWAAVQ